MNLFYLGVITTLAKLARSCVVRITKDLLYFIIVEETAATSKPVVWCLLEQTHYFNEYSMAGVSEEQNEIFLEFEPGKQIDHILDLYLAIDKMDALYFCNVNCVCIWLR